jgi:hypothetical protein
MDKPSIIPQLKDFFDQALAILAERESLHGNITDPIYHLNGINVKTSRLINGRNDLDTHLDLAAYAALHWLYTIPKDPPKDDFKGKPGETPGGMKFTGRL